jgi:hypothetical protein
MHKENLEASKIASFLFKNEVDFIYKGSNLFHKNQLSNCF